MRILLSNDDGYFAPGLAALAEALQDIGEVVVVAPEQNRSGASNSLTLDRPLLLKKAASGFYFVNGTPTDCVHLAVTGMLDELPDIIVSGINLGANMGDDTIYSGTVAAATEGYLLGIPSIAISMTSFEGNNFASAGRVARELVERFIRNPIREPVLLNVNDNHYYGLDDVATRMWQLLIEHGTETSVIRQMLEEYEVDEATLRQDFAALVAEMERRGLIQRVAGQ